MKTNAFVKLVTVMAVSLGLATVACSGEAEFKGSCMIRSSGVVSCYDFYGDESEGVANSQCEGAKRYGARTKYSPEKCPAEGRTATDSLESDDNDARIDVWSYEDAEKVMPSAAK